MVMSPQDLVRYCVNTYNDMGKILIKKGLLARAAEQVGGIGVVIDGISSSTGIDYRAQIGDQVHCGREFLQSIDSLEGALKSGDPVAVEVEQEMFEAYAAQTRLPCRKE